MNYFSLLISNKSLIKNQITPVTKTLKRNFQLNVAVNKNYTTDDKIDKTPGLPEPPTNCCFSGCANCVWIKYAEEISGLFNDAEDKVKNIILNKIDDPNMKAFLQIELKSVKFKKL